MLLIIYDKTALNKLLVKLYPVLLTSSLLWDAVLENHVLSYHISYKFSVSRYGPRQKYVNETDLNCGRIGSLN